jgi:WD40 repeat protein
MTKSFITLLSSQVVSNVGNQYGEAAYEVGQYPHLSPVQAMWAIPGIVDMLNEGNEPGDIYTGLSASSRYITGDKEGLVVVWRLMCLPNSQLRLKLVSILDVSTLCPAPVCPSVRSLCERNGTILIGTLGSEIYEVFEDSMHTVKVALIALKTRREARDASSPSTIQSPQLASLNSRDVLPPTYSTTSEVKDNENSRHKDKGALDTQVCKEAVNVPALRIMSGHYKGELSGLAVHPNLPVYVTCGDDGYIRCWSLVNHKMLSYMKISDKLRAVDILPINGREIAVSLNSGAVWVIKANILLNPKNVPLVEVDLTLSGYEAVLSAEVLQVAHRIAQSTASQPSVSPAVTPLGIRPPCDVLIVTSAPNLWVQELKYCFDGTILGVGCRDGTISLFDVSNAYAPRTTSHLLSPADGVPIKHDSFMTHFDFGVILECSPEGILSYDEVNRKIVTSQWLAGSDSIFRSDVAGVSGSVRQGTKSNTADQSVTDDDIKKKRLVVLSTRDLTANDICIQSVCGAGELLYWRLDGTRVRSVETVKDAWWSSWTVPVGWPVQGIWPPGVDSTEYSINAVARSHSYRSVPVLATADEYGRVKIFNYPCVTPGSPDKCYKGHSSHITNIKFSSDDAFCITIGGSDRCVFVWGTDIIQERRVREALSGSGGGRSGRELRLSTATEEHESFLPFKDMVPKGGDENMAIKPWLGAVRVPSAYTEPVDLGEAPGASLELKFVYGYRGWDCRDNISYADSSHEILYHVGAVGIAFNIENQTQILNTEHDDDILCLAVHPEGHTVATGEIGPHPKIGTTVFSKSGFSCHKI